MARAHTHVAMLSATLRMKPDAFQLNVDRRGPGAFCGNPPDQATRDERAAYWPRADRKEQGPMPYYRCAACGLVSYSPAAHASALVCPTCSAPLSDAPKLSLVPGSMPDVGYDFLAGL